MPIALGTLVYEVGGANVHGNGYSYSAAELAEAMRQRVPDVLSDRAGRDELDHYFASFDLTGFGRTEAQRALTPLPPEDHARGWREGEALAEAWLVDHKQCTFPWPFNRDLRHFRASLPGAEMVGFSGVTDDDARLIFGQVKTSKEPKYPPQVVTAKEKGLITQAMQLRDDRDIKTTLVTYLAYRAPGQAWSARFRNAATKYFNSGQTEITVIGILIRDVAPNRDDLDGAMVVLADGCHASMNIELHALYLPTDSIVPGPQHGPRKRADR